VNKDDLAKEQVEAFLKHLSERLGTDEGALQSIIEKQKRNGKAYVTWGVIVTVLFGLVSYLLNRNIEAFDKRLEAVEHRQSDVRERLRALEELMHQHVEEARRR
jgi:prefoldin subunit 5